MLTADAFDRCDGLWWNGENNQYQCYEKAERKHLIVFVNKQVLSLTDLADRKLVLNRL